MVRIHLIPGIVAIMAMASFTATCAEYTYDEEGCLESHVVFDKGLGCWVYHDTGANADKPVRVWYYYPPNYSSGSGKVVFAMHGSSRNAHESIERWQLYADEYGALIVAPEFNRQQYPKGRHYNRGNVRNYRGKIRHKSNWTYMTIEEIFDLVLQEIPDAPDSYSIQGHSAGGQFVHRLVLMVPEARIETAVAANAGWYLLPDDYDNYPCGISNVPIQDNDLENAYAKDLVLTLGIDDDDPDDPGLNHDACAEAQGSHRYERGHFFYTYAQADAWSRGHEFNWTLVDVASAGHSADSVVESSADAIFRGEQFPENTTLLPTQDSIVKARYPRSNYGARKVLQVDGNSVKTTYMQFDLRAIKAVDSAILRLKIKDPSNGIQRVRAVANNTWDEDTLTYKNRPASTTNLASFNGGAKGSWVSIDITDYVVAKKGKMMSIALESKDSDGLYFNSKESTNAPPELVIYD